MVDLWVPEKGGSGCALGGHLGAGRASSCEAHLSTMSGLLCRRSGLPKQCQWPGYVME